MPTQTYAALPESICFALRGAHDGFAHVEPDVANNCLVIDGHSVSRSDALDYFDKWRKSGLWALRGFHG